MNPSPPPPLPLHTLTNTTNIITISPCSHTQTPINTPITSLSQGIINVASIRAPRRKKLQLTKQTIYTYIFSTFSRLVLQQEKAEVSIIKAEIIKASIRGKNKLQHKIHYKLFFFSTQAQDFSTTNVSLRIINAVIIIVAIRKKYSDNKVTRQNVHSIYKYYFFQPPAVFIIWKLMSAGCELLRLLACALITSH